MANNKLKIETLIQDLFSDTRQKRPVLEPGSSKLLRDKTLVTPSQTSITRLAQIPLLSATPDRLTVTPGIVGYDSWSGANRVRLRDVSDGHIRNVILGAEKVQLELVGELRANFWDFVARVYEEDEVKHEYALQAGRKRLLPDSSGFFTWKSKSVVRNLKLYSLTRVLEFEALSW